MYGAVGCAAAVAAIPLGPAGLAVAGLYFCASTGAGIGKRAAERKLKGATRLAALSSPSKPPNARTLLLVHVHTHTSPWNSPRMRLCPCSWLCGSARV